jgi:hypothetical protein
MENDDLHQAAHSQILITKYQLFRRKNSLSLESVFERLLIENFSIIFNI